MSTTATSSAEGLRRAVRGGGPGPPGHRAVIEGKPDVVELAITVLLAEGHLLIEDVPGVGKTMLAKALARSIDCSVRRIQFTPDLLPSDITGVSVFNQEIRDFEFKPGAVFANIVVGDEINRASPKTQSALLESMEERQVTVDATTYELETPFMVIATQNPIEMEGTYPLPEAQRDRFMARVSMGYPEPAAELPMLDGHAADDPLDDLQPVADGQRDPAADRDGARCTSPRRSRSTPSTWSARPARRRSSGSAPPRAPRCTCCAPPGPPPRWTRREYVLPDDIQELAVPVLAHRLLPAAEAQLGGRRAADIIVRAGGHRCRCPARRRD